MHCATCHHFSQTALALEDPDNPEAQAQLAKLRQQAQLSASESEQQQKEAEPQPQPQPQPQVTALLYSKLLPPQHILAICLPMRIKYGSNNSLRFDYYIVRSLSQPSLQQLPAISPQNDGEAAALDAKERLVRESQRVYNERLMATHTGACTLNRSLITMHD